MGLLSILAGLGRGAKPVIKGAKPLVRIADKAIFPLVKKAEGITPLTKKLGDITPLTKKVENITPLRKSFRTKEIEPLARAKEVTEGAVEETPENIGNFISSDVEGAARGLKWVSRGFRTPSKVLDKDPVGREIGQELERAERSSMMFEHQMLKDMPKLSSGKAVELFNQVESGKVTDPAAKWFVKQWDNMHDLSVKLGVLKPEQRITHYATHIIDQDKLWKTIQVELKDIGNQVKQLQKFGKDVSPALSLRRVELEKIAHQLQAGNIWHTGQFKPAEVFRFAQPRKGFEYIQKDLAKAYSTYVYNLSRHIFKAPVVERAQKKLINMGDRELAKWTNEYLKDWYSPKYGGFGEKLATGVRSFQFARVLGLSTRSAIVNLTQGINTLAGLGLSKTIKASRDLLMDTQAHELVKRRFPGAESWKDAFDASGIPEKIAHQFVEVGRISGWLRKVNSVSGYLFNKVEYLNRGTAWIGSMKKALNEGKNIDDALKMAYENVRDWQFFYGKAGMPRHFASPAGATAFQFWSFAIKQTELLAGNFKKLKNPATRAEGAKFLSRYFGAAIAGDITAQKVLGINLNNALGVGVDTGKIYDAILELNEKEIDEAIKDIRKATWEALPRPWKAGGPGLFPTGLGPTINQLVTLGKGIRGQEPIKEIAYDELTPLAIRRLVEGTKALDLGKPLVKGKFPKKVLMRHPKTGRGKYYLSPKDVFIRTFVAKPQAEIKEVGELEKGYKVSQKLQSYVNELRKAYISGNSEAIKDIMVEAKAKGIPMAQLVKALKGISTGEKVPERVERMRKRGLLPRGRGMEE